MHSNPAKRQYRNLPLIQAGKNKKTQREVRAGQKDRDVGSI